MKGARAAVVLVLAAAVAGIAAAAPMAPNASQTRATALVWLDFAFSLVFSRAVRRTLRRTWTREELWAGNRESWVHAFDSEWIPWWVLRTYRRRRREWPALLASPEHRHLRVLRLRRPDEARRLLREVEDGRDVERGSAK